MKIKKILAVLLVLAMSASMFAGCGKKEKSDNGNTKASPSAAATTGAPTTAAEPTKAAANPAGDDRSAYPGTADENAITANLATEPPEMNSIKMSDTVSFTVLRHIIENLVMLDENDKVIPGVAKDWTASKDGLTYTFNLREGMKWTNGEPVTAKDFVFAWTQLLTAETAAPYAYFGYVFKNGKAFNEGKAKAEDLGFKAVSDYQLQITLENPTPYFVSTLAFGVFAPVNEKAYKEIGADKYGTDADKMVYNGPFKMTSWEHESKIVLDKNPDFYDASKISLNKITFVMINDTNAIMNAFKAGEVDVAGLTGDQTKLMEGESFPVYHYDDGSVFYLEYNLKDKQLQNANLRKAITYAVDKKAFVDAIVKDDSKAAVSFTAPAINGLQKKFSEEVGELVPVIDVAKAKEFLDKAKQELGTDKISLTMISDDGDNAVKQATFIQEQLKQNLGIDLKVESMPFKSRIEKMDNKDFSIVFAGWGPDYNDPMTFLDMFETGNGNNHTSYSDKDYDALLANIRKESDPQKRFGYLMDTEKKLMNDLPIGPVFWRIRNYVLSGKIESGVIRTAFQDMNYRFVKLAQTK